LGGVRPGRPASCRAATATSKARAVSVAGMITVAAATLGAAAIAQEDRGTGIRGRSGWTRSELARWREQIMKFRTYVEPAEPMRGLEVPQEVVEALGGGPRPRVTITINGHPWKSRVAIMRGRYLLGLSNANRQAAGVVTGDEVEVEVEVDAEPPVVVEPADFARALDADPVVRAAYDRLAYSRKREHVRAIESAKKPETRIRRIEKAVAMLRDRE
jgi:Bacteriocin-protection, YdeI or OmpD-Associated/Domain of unknown function (DUF1905)